MSILNVRVEPRVALLAVDTYGVTPDGTRGHVSKMLVLPHLNAVIACRGHMAFFGYAFTMCHLLAATFDQLAGIMPELLFEARAQARKNAALIGLSGETFDRQEIALVGWSERDQRMVGWFFDQPSAQRGFAQAFIPSSLVCPHDPSMAGPSCPRTFADMEHVAREQLRLMHRICPAIATGGQLIFAEVTRNTVTFVHGPTLSE